VSTVGNPKVDSPKIRKYLKYCWALDTVVAVDKIANDLGYGSPQALYKSLIQNGFPVCEVCGATPVAPDHCKRLAKRRAKSANDGEVVELPPAREAIPLFRQIIGLPNRFLDGSLYSYISERGLHSYAEDLRDLEEELHGKRFVSNKVFRPENGVGFEGTLRRNDYSEEEWQQICEVLDQDQRVTDEITPYDVPGGPGMVPQGAGKTPSKELVVLIAVYALGGEVKYIDVKTTRGTAQTPFYISLNEVEFSNKHPDNYYLYRVCDYEEGSNSGKFYVNVGSVAEAFHLTPAQYRAVRS
jgi:hypothetical protein